MLSRDIQQNGEIITHQKARKKEIKSLFTDGK